MFRASSAHLQEDTVVYMHHMVLSVTLYESSWWPVGAQLERELTAGGRLLVGRPTNNLPLVVSSHSSCAPTGHHELS